MNDHKLLIERKLNSKEVFKGKLLHVFYDEARLPDGSVSSREWIKHPGACAVVPVFDNGELMMLRQFRYPMRQIFWEVPAGKIDSGEKEDEKGRDTDIGGRKIWGKGRYRDRKKEGWEE
jgi:ADP-ribose pyrophosphatase